MNELASQSQLDAAALYEEFFVPALFRPWASRVIRAAQLRRGQRVLDVACGTGVLAREVAVRVAPGGSVAGLDLDAGMLAVAERLAPEIEWRQGTAESLPWPDRVFDAVVSQFGLMFFPDRNRAIREMLRVLAPDGRLAVAVWGSLEHTPAYAAEVELVQRLAGDRAAGALRTPFVLGDPEELAALLEAAGVASVEVVTASGVGRFPSTRSMLEADLRGWLPVVGADLPEERIQGILSEAELALGPWVRSEGEGVAFDLQAHIATGKRP